MRRGPIAFAAVLAALTLTGCEASPKPMVSAAPSATEAVRPADVRATTSTLAPQLPPPVKTEECHDWEFTAPDDPESVTGWKQQIPVDSGVREHARGVATVNDSGVPVSYVVAPDDWPDAVSERFCINLAYLNTLNSVRREGALRIWAGDTLNLDAHTILTVGDQNGVVQDNLTPSPIPPQH